MDKLRGLLLGIVFAAVAVGFAAAMPGAMTVSDTDSTDEVEFKEASSRKNTPKPDKSDSEDEDEVETEDVETEDAEGGPKVAGDTHGSVVSTVAKCDVKGRWHGEAVRSIAQNPDATLDDAAAACAAAQAEATAAGGPGKSAEAKADHGPSTGQPATTGRPSPKPPKPPTAPNDQGPPPGKGNPHKP